MKYLIINGSPHKGNTWKLVEKVVEYIKNNDRNAKISDIQLIKENIPFCIGCSNCFRKGNENCPHADKMTKLISAMDEADGVIVATSIFNVGETGVLKNFFDHLSYMMHRPHFFTKKGLVLASVGAVGGKGVVKKLMGTLRGTGFNKCYGMSVMSASWNDYKMSSKTANKLKKKVNRFTNDVESGKYHFQKTNLLIPYNLFRGMCINCAPGTEYESYDGVFWTSPERSKGVYDKQIPTLLYQKLIGSMFYAIGKIAGKKVSVTYKK